MSRKGTAGAAFDMDDVDDGEFARAFELSGELLTRAKGFRCPRHWHAASW